MKTIIALSRYIGLRIPSELQGLKWSDITWSDSENAIGRIVVTDVKRGKHSGLDKRVSPLWPEAEKELRALFDEAKEGAIYVFPNATINANLRTTFEKAIVRAGFDLWPRLFHNLRASCETDYDRAGIPERVYCKWIGNSPRIAQKHYLRYDETDLQAGINTFLAGSGNTGTGSENQPGNQPEGNQSNNSSNPIKTGLNGTRKSTRVEPENQPELNPKINPD